MAGQQPEKSKPRIARGRGIALASGDMLRYSTERGKTLVELRPAKKTAAKTQILLSRDETVAPASPIQNFELLAEKPSGVYVLTDRYASRPGPMSYCQAGQEQFVRVLVGLRVRSRGLRETFSLKVQSCRSNLDLGPAGVSWDNASSTLTVDGEKPKRYRIGDDGLVAPLATPY
ncbi:MAG TPA: hypothetical protein VK493_13395 [Bryobacteraceae bacterium]|nr:hypothetical protein [Bryobacteraceae bacterium]